MTRVVTDELHSAMDRRLLLRTLRIYGRHTLRELRQGKL